MTLLKDRIMIFCFIWGIIAYLLGFLLSKFYFFSLGLLPFAPFVFLSVIILTIFAFLLIRYTWGSVTKFLAIALLAGALVQAYLFWPEIQMMINSPQGQRLIEGSKEKIKDNLYYRLRRELLY